MCSSISHHWLFLDPDDQEVVDSTAPQHSKTRLMTFKKVVKHWKAVSSTTSGSTGGKGCGQMACPRCREVHRYKTIFDKIICLHSMHLIRFNNTSVICMCECVCVLSVDDT